mmetsp:Transcript_9246/g.17962  ORF Transcript_9246/g.17962 Transcript_9246/m.17962 type:complete len:246 (-) Transcript_9246:178-915(-)
MTMMMYHVCTRLRWHEIVSSAPLSISSSAYRIRFHGRALSSLDFFGLILGSRRRRRNGSGHLIVCTLGFRGFPWRITVPRLVGCSVVSLVGVLKECNYVSHSRTVAELLGRAPSRERSSRHGTGEGIAALSIAIRNHHHLAKYPREHSAERVHVRLERVFRGLRSVSGRCRADLRRRPHGFEVVDAAEPFLKWKLAAAGVRRHPNRGPEAGDLGDARRVDEDRLRVDVLVTHEVLVQVEQAPRTA